LLPFIFHTKNNLKNKNYYNIKQALNLSLFFKIKEHINHENFKNILSLNYFFYNQAKKNMESNYIYI